MTDVSSLVMSTLLPHAREKSLSLELDFDPELRVWADPQMLQSVLRNLIGNSMKFSETGQSLRLEARKVSAGVEIIVADQGLGMPKEISSRLFVAGRGDMRREGTRGESGSGIGLLLCKAFMDHHGGSIRAESEPGKWTRMYLFFPDGQRKEKDAGPEGA